MPGSVIAIAVMISPQTKPGSQRSFCSSVHSVEQVRRDDVVLQREPDAHGAGVDDLLAEDGVVAEVADPGAAELLRDVEAEQPVRAGLVPDVAVDDPVLLPLRVCGAASRPRKSWQSWRKATCSSSKIVRSTSQLCHRTCSRPGLRHSCRQGKMASVSTASRRRRSRIPPRPDRAPRPGGRGARRHDQPAACAQRHHACGVRRHRSGHGRARRRRGDPGRHPDRRRRNVLRGHGPEGVRARRGSVRSRPWFRGAGVRAAQQAAHRCGRGLGAGRWLRDRAVLRSGDRRRDGEVRHPRSQARAGGGCGRSLRLPLRIPYHVAMELVLTGDHVEAPGRTSSGWSTS